MAKKKKQTTTKQIVNRRARHDYELGDSIVRRVAAPDVCAGAG
jgi:hypothetical protein